MSEGWRESLDKFLSILALALALVGTIVLATYIWWTEESWWPVFAIWTGFVILVLILVLVVRFLLLDVALIISMILGGIYFIYQVNNPQPLQEVASIVSNLPWWGDNLFSLVAGIVAGYLIWGHKKTENGE
jgi:hypothetical protein